MEKWYRDEKIDGSPVISSRVRLARNIRKLPFHIKLNEDAAKELVKYTTEAIINDRTPLGSHFEAINVNEKTEIERRVLLERHVVSPEFLTIKSPVGLLLQDDETVSVMLNEEDHIRIQTIAPGDGIAEAWNMADKIDDLIEESVEYAFDKAYGYLTSCPTNAGTGLRASYMVHLPMLEKTGQLKNLLPAVSKFGMTLRGIYGEGTEPMGSIYQISNQITMGKSEQEIIEALKNVTNLIIEKENSFAGQALEGARIELEDSIYRCYGIICNSRKLSAKEAMGLLSNIRFGFMRGVLDVPKPALHIYNIMMNIQPGNLQKMQGKGLNEYQQEVARAEYLRSIFAV